MGKINRNAPCPCGSGKKYKNCCIAGDVAGDVAGDTAEGTNDLAEWGKQSRGRDQDNQIDRFIIQGYDHLDKQEISEACDAWSRVWDLFLLRLRPGMTTCDKTLTEYDGSFFLVNWIQDYCAALHRAALADVGMAPKGAAFCSEVLWQFTGETAPLPENFRASLGEFHFLAGDPDEGEKVLLSLIADLPHRAVGYAYLADMMGDAKFNSGQDQPLDLPRAIAVLEQALTHPVEDAPDYDLERRLGRFEDHRKS